MSKEEKPSVKVNWKKLIMLLIGVVIGGILMTIFMMSTASAVVIVSETPTGVTLDSNTSDTGSFGYNITIGSYTQNLVSVHKDSYEGATKARLRYGGNTTDIAVADFVGNVANFSYIPLVAGTYYQIVTDKDGASRNLHYDGTMGGYPIAGTNLTWTDRVGLGPTQAGGLISVEYTYGTPVPSVTLLNPPNTQSFLNGSNVVISVLPYSPALTSGLYVVIYSNVTGSWARYVTNSSAFNNTQTNFTITNPEVTTWLWGAYVNDTSGNSAFSESNRTFSIGNIAFNELTFEPSVLEQSSTTFRQNFSIASGYSISAVNLTYNQTNYSASFTAVNATYYQASATITTPIVSANTNKTFNWTVGFTSGNTYTSGSNEQTVVNFAIDNCALNTIQILNFSLVNEETQASLNATGDNTSINVEIKLYPNGSIVSPSYTFSAKYNQTLPARVCINSSLGTSIFYMYAQVQYDAVGFASELYNIHNYSLNVTSNPSENITLYDLNDSYSQAYKITYKDSSFLPVDSALIQVQRKYVDEGKYKVVEIPSTDSDGKAVVHLVSNDVIYSFIVTKNGRVLATFNDVKAICQNPLIETCEINLNNFATSIGTTDFAVGDDFSYTLTYDKTAREISSTFTIPSGAVSWVTLNITVEDTLQTSVCNQQITTSAGTLTCAVGSTFGNSTVLAKLYKDGVLQGQGQIKLDQDPKDIFVGSQIILALLLVLTLIGVSISDNPVYTVISLLIGVIFLFALNLISNKGFIGATATILYFVIATIIILIKGGNRS